MNYLSDSGGEATEAACKSPPVEEVIQPPPGRPGAWVITPRLIPQVYRRVRRAARFLSAALIVLVVSGGATAFAEDNAAGGGDFLWLIEGPQAAGDEEVFGGIDEALAEESEGHLLGTSRLRERVIDRGGRLSGCVVGLHPCGSAETMAFDALGLALIVRLHVERFDRQVKINYRLVDRRGDVVDQGEVEAADDRQAGFVLVGQLFDAVGFVSFDSDPPGALLSIDGEVIGETPLSRQMPVGSYTYTLELDRHQVSHGQLSVRTGDVQVIDEVLEELPGSLRVQGAPQEALVYLDDELIGRASEVLSLPAGRHALELRAEGYEELPVSVEIEAATMLDLEVEMRAPLALFRDVSASEIAGHRFQVEFGLEGGVLGAGLLSATGDVQGQEVRFDGWIGDGGELSTTGPTLLRSGLRVGLAWEGDWLGLGLLSISAGSAGLDQSVRLRSHPDGTTISARLVGMDTLQIRPMQARIRFFYENLAPYAQGGLGLGIYWFDTEISDARSTRLRQTEAFASVEAGVRYHFDARWSVVAHARLHSFFDEGLGPEATLGISAGMGLRDLPGIQRRPPGEL